MWVVRMLLTLVLVVIVTGFAMLNNAERATVTLWPRTVVFFEVPLVLLLFEALYWAPLSGSSFRSSTKSLSDARSGSSSARTRTSTKRSPACTASRSRRSRDRLRRTTRPRPGSRAEGTDMTFVVIAAAVIAAGAAFCTSAQDAQDYANANSTSHLTISA